MNVSHPLLHCCCPQHLILHLLYTIMPHILTVPPDSFWFTSLQAESTNELPPDTANVLPTKPNTSPTSTVSVVDPIGVALTRRFSAVVLPGMLFRVNEGPVTGWRLDALLARLGGPSARALEICEPPPDCIGFRNLCECQALLA